MKRRQSNTELPDLTQSDAFTTFNVTMAIYETKTVEELDRLKDIVVRTGLQEQFIKHRLALQKGGH
jgi:hypothetical protein